MAHDAGQRGPDDRAKYQLETYRRSIDRPRDRFGGFALLLVIAVLAGVFYLQRYRQPEAPATAASTPPQPVARVPRDTQVVAPAAGDIATYETPAQDCGYVNGERRCFARSASADDDGPSAADRYARAIRIMQSGRASARADAPAYDDPYRGNNALRVADQICARWLPQHLIAYRHCRAEQWQKLRGHCIAARQELQMASGRRYDALKRSAEEYCSAEQRYEIVDRR